MLKRLRNLCFDERGMSFVFVGIGLMTFMAATTLAVDVGMFMTARTQAQTSADAGALAGATALVFNNWDDRTSSGHFWVTIFTISSEIFSISGLLATQSRVGTKNFTPCFSRCRTFCPNWDSGNM